MKPCIITTVLLGLFLTTVCKSQTQPSNSEILDFNEFLSIFGKFDEQKEREREVHRPSYFHYFNEDDLGKEIVGINDRGILNSSNAITVLVEIGHPAGGYASTLQIATFSIIGKLLNKKNLGINMLNLDGGIQCTVSFYENSLLEVHKVEIENTGEDYEIERIIDESLDYFLIDEYGFKKFRPVFSAKRKFPEASYRLIELEEFKNYSNEELQLMRNEIFADHGYIFKSAKWKSYFIHQFWYRPRYKNTDNLLTLIEKINISRILQIDN